jgi:hypothetical protein
MTVLTERYIPNPAQLQDLNLALTMSDLTVADNPHDSAGTTRQAMPHLRLALLYPLADPAMFAACRNPAPNTSRLPNGQVDEASIHELLDISALAKAWRHAMAKAPPTAHITIDLSFPKPGAGNDSAEVNSLCWDTALPRDMRCFGIAARNVMRLVVCITTLARMRVQGEVHFALGYDEANRTASKVINSLMAQLKNIEKAEGGALRPGPLDGVHREESIETTDTAGDG